MSNPDVVVLGEPLIEISTVDPIAPRTRATLDVSGDVINVAAAAVAAGARVAAIARVSDDELGTAVCTRLAELGVNTDHVRRVPGFQGIYVQHADPSGERQFCYARAGSAGSTLCSDDLPDGLLESAGAVVASGITGALSVSARDALIAAATRAARFVYDPNFRPRLTTAAQARELLRALAPHSALITPSAPGEITTLLDAENPQSAADAVLALGTTAVAVTCGSAGVHVQDASGSRWQPAIPAPAVVDQTGAGDVFVGTLSARLALGDSLFDAAQLAAGASSLAVGGAGGSGGIRPLEQVREHIATHAAEFTR
ncbi:MAG: PfkB family carbohydrate kinase [Gordonia sp. (in: high G+C Gram-positive bacteria)]